MRHRRGLLLAAGIVAVLLLLAALGAGLLMQPQRLAGLVLDSVGDSLGLEISFEGQARYRLRGTPMLEVHGVEIRRAGSDVPMLRAERALVSLPWSAVRNRAAAPLALQRIELDAPVLDVARLQEWLAGRPPGEGGLPTLSDGFAAGAGRIVGDGWELRALDLQLPRLAGDRPLAASARGSLVMAAPPVVHFDLQLAASRPASGAGMAAHGQLRVEHVHWQLPAYVAASGPVVFGSGGVHIAPLRLGVSGEYRGEGEPLAFSLGAHGPLRLRDGRWTLVPATVLLSGSGVVPTLDAAGRATLGRTLLLEFEGAVRQWPAAWPELPPPLGTSASPVDFRLGYAGARDLSDPVVLRVRRDDARAEARGRIFELLDWMDAAASGSPLPPLRASANVPRMEIAGAVLEGVELSIEDEGVP